MKVYDLKVWIEKYPDDATVWIADFEYADFYDLEPEYLEVSEKKPEWSKEFLE